MIFKLQKINNEGKQVTFITSPAEALVIAGALNSLVNDENAHNSDRQMAKRLLEEIKNSKYEKKEQYEQNNRNQHTHNR